MVQLPGIPQWDKYDFFIFLMIFATSIGEVLSVFKGLIPSFLCKRGTGSFGLFTVAFEAKNLLNMLL